MNPHRDHNGCFHWSTSQQQQQVLQVSDSVSAYLHSQSFTSEQGRLPCAYPALRPSLTLQIAARHGKLPLAVLFAELGLSGLSGLSGQFSSEFPLRIGSQLQLQLHCNDGHGNCNGSTYCHHVVQLQTTAPRFTLYE